MGCLTSGKDRTPHRHNARQTIPTRVIEKQRTYVLERFLAKSSDEPPYPDIALSANVFYIPQLVLLSFT
jgi:hypothetical protein